MVRGLAQEFLDDQVEQREFLTGKALLEDELELAAFFRKECKITLRAPNVSCENHQFPPRFLNRFNEPIVATTGCTIVCRRVRGEYRIPEAPNCRPGIVAQWRSGRRPRPRECDPRAPRPLRRYRRDQKASHRRGRNR